MRIISGSARGIPLRIPSHDVRPTMEMVRGAIFSALGERVAGAKVLDLFSGSGAFGIEALSRGAATATFVDDHPKAIVAIKANLEKTRLEASVVRSDVFRFLERTDQIFDLIFADRLTQNVRKIPTWPLSSLPHQRLKTTSQPAACLSSKKRPATSLSKTTAGPSYAIKLTAQPAFFF